MSKIALITGINYYEKFQPLYGCVRDANDVAELLRENFDGSRNFDIKRDVASNYASRLSRKQLKESLRKLFRKDVQVALFYFSGHGHVEDNEGYLVTSDCDHGDEGLSLSTLLDYANNSPAKNRIIILDCCYAGQMGLDIHSNGISALAEGVSILCSSSNDEVSIENAGRGVFTSLLVDALEGSAADILGNIFLENLYANIAPALGLWNQTPVNRLSISGLTLIKETKPAVELDDLRMLTEYFEDEYHSYPLTPEHEHTYKNADPEKGGIFRVLQNFNRINLVVPVGAEPNDMYWAAMQRKSCKLTPWGRYYWKLVNEDRI